MKNIKVLGSGCRRNCQTICQLIQEAAKAHGVKIER
jgi:hypothetical protein